MTMAESAVEDAAAAPPGPAKPPPPSCTNNNTLAATANRNHHRASRKRRRLNQVLDDLNAHKSLPSEHETSLATTRLEVTSLASEEEEDAAMVFGSPRTVSEHAVQAITKRLKAERLEGSTDEEAPPSNLPYQTYYTHNQNHSGFRMEESKPDTSLQNNRGNRIASLDHQRISHPHSHHNHHHHHHHHHQHNNQQPQQASYQHQRATQKYRNCPCPNWVSQPLSAILLPSPKSPLTPPTVLTPLTPVSLTPLTPVSSPSSYSFEQYFNTKYMPEVGRKRSHSDSDVAGRDQRSSVSSISTCSQRTPRGSSLESEPTGSPQDSPLDLSMKNLALVHNSVNSTNNNNNSSHSNYNTNPTITTTTAPTTTTTTTTNNRPTALQLLPSAHVTRGSVSVPVVRGDVASPTTKESVASRYNLEVSPVVEEMPPGADVAYVCPVCGQMFSLHDRLAKHMASRHRRQGARDASAKAYRCEVCKRSFARSDMLTRHMRLHTGVKPYTCKVCNQVFSRSDHLSTHQRTHTGEKPYKCPQCVYAACRRDMITRHLRTHAKIGDGQVAKSETSPNTAIPTSGNPTGSESPSYGLDPIPGLVKME